VPAPTSVYNSVKQYFIPPKERGLAWNNIVFVLGGPGCGKGTQCEKLAREFKYAHISCGDLLRAEVATGSDRAKELDALMKEGKMVPLHVTLDLIREAMILVPRTSNGIFLDGFPRTMEQAVAFEATVAPCKFALFFDCPEEEMKKRLMKRGETSGRADDNMATIAKRFATFTATSYPVIEALANVGKCVKVCKSS
jgi:adenylate kinase family enzyme